MLDFYVIVTAEGKLKHNRLYLKQSRAEKGASADGDSVVMVGVAHSVAPVFIRRKSV